jgi:hypothetical protein
MSWCVCPQSHPYCWSNDQWCYLTATSGLYSSICGGSCTSHYVASPPPAPPFSSVQVASVDVGRGPVTVLAPTHASATGTALPLVLNLPGYGGHANQFEHSYGLHSMSEQYGIISIVAEGRIDASGWKHWQAWGNWVGECNATAAASSSYSGYSGYSYSGNAGSYSYGGSSSYSSYSYSGDHSAPSGSCNSLPYLRAFCAPALRDHAPPALMRRRRGLPRSSVGRGSRELRARRHRRQLFESPRERGETDVQRGLVTNHGIRPFQRRCHGLPLGVRCC